MIELILIVISFTIIIYISFTSKKNKKEKIFEEVLNENNKLDTDIVLFELKQRNFIDKVVYEINKYEKTSSIISVKDSSGEGMNNQKITILKHMLESGYDEIEICKALSIGRGEFLLLKNLYKK